MKTVREWLPDWVENHSEVFLRLLNVSCVLDNEAESVEAAAAMVNARLTELRRWLSGVHVKLPEPEPVFPEGFNVLADASKSMCRGLGPTRCQKANACLRHNTCMYVKSWKVDGG